MRNSLFIFFLGLIFVTGCKTNSDDDTEIQESYITKIEGPDKAIVGDNVEITVHFTGVSGCSNPYSIEANKVGQTIELRAFYSQSESETCTANIPELNLNYTFFADLPGPYFFISHRDNSISDTLVVQ